MDAAGTRKGGLFGQPVAVASRCGVLPREEGEDRAGMALLVAVVEVVRAGVIEIDGLLHEAEPQDARVKLQVSGCAPGDGGDVMDAGHGVANSCRVGPLRPFMARPRAEGSALRNVVLVAVHDNAQQAAGTMLQRHSRPVVRGTTYTEDEPRSARSRRIK